MMNKKVITFVPDSTAFVAELLEKYPQYITVDEAGHTFTPLHEVRASNEHGSLAICLLDDAQLEAIASATSIKNLGWYPEVLDNPDYKQVYPYDVPVEYVDEDCTTVSYTLPPMVGDIA